LGQKITLDEQLSEQSTGGISSITGFVLGMVVVGAIGSYCLFRNQNSQSNINLRFHELQEESADN